MKIMKAKYALIALLTVTFFGCDDNTAGLGLGMFPGSDQGINGKLSTFDVITSSIPTGRIYAKTNIGYVGKFTDNTFGAYQAGFLATLNCPDGLTFPAIYEVTEKDGSGNATKAKGSMVIDENDKDITVYYDENDNPIGNIHTVELYLWYDSYFGDSLTACRLSVYELNKKLELNSGKDVYYTDIVPEKYYNPSSLLGTKAYTAVDLSVKDSIRNLSTYVPSVHLNLQGKVAQTVGEKILRVSRLASPNFDNESFLEKFPGIYVKSDYGDGTVLYISQVQMNVVYKCYAVDEKTGLKLKKKAAGETEKDSTYYAYRPFNSTREVIQANRLENNSDKINEIIGQGNNTYLKSPAGIFTQAELPISKIGKDLEQDSLNAVKLTFSNYNQASDKKFGMSIPQNVMLIRYKQKDSFFEKNQLPNNVSSFLSSHSSSTNQYTFSNITKLINDCLAEREEVSQKLARKESVTITTFDEKGDSHTETFTGTIDEWEKVSNWNKVVLIPVLITYDNSNSSYGGTPNVISLQHDLKPGYVRLKGGSNANNPDLPLNEQEKYKLKLEVISTSFTATK